MKILLSGPPGSGKTHIGHWLTKAYGFFHLDMEAWPSDVSKASWDARNVESFAAELSNYGDKVALTWGFPHVCLALVKRMRAAGIVPIWLDAPLLFCRSHWRPKPGQSDGDFIRQIQNIEQGWQELNAFYQDHAICA